MEFTTKQAIVLASGSPRRQEMLGNLGIPFETMPSDVEEVVELLEGDFNDYAEKLAFKKAAAVSELRPDAIIIAADTIVVFEGKVYPKPGSKEQAESFLSAFSNNTHSVFTGVSILGNGLSTVFSVETKVSFKKLDEQLIRAYVDSGDPMDKAGGYGIQTGGALLVEKIEGDYLNVVGLPLSKLVEEMREAGIIQLKEGE